MAPVDSCRSRDAPQVDVVAGATKDGFEVSAHLGRGDAAATLATSRLAISPWGR
jgi:hypothetical protein